MGFLENILVAEKRHYHKAEKLCQQVLAQEDRFANMQDDELKDMTIKLRQQLAEGKKLEDILVDAFATAREACKRVIHEFPYPVQILGGILLHFGDIAEMKTGEGKTLTAVMPIYLNALEGKGAHVVTVNEYLAHRDALWMGEIYRFLGLQVGCNLHQYTQEQKREAYACDITYTTNSELGFDYLRDNMVLRNEDRVLRGLHYAILDEVDSILIDESRTPLIISGPGPLIDHQYIQADRFAKSLDIQKDIEISQEDRSVVLTDQGIAKAEAFFGLDNIYGHDASLVHFIQNALRANYMMHKDVEYVVGENEIILIDEFTGRKMEGREFSDGLHQAIQAKENIGIKQETQTLATITYQNFFRLYTKLSGMSGTAKTEEEELLNTYNMRVYAIPTNRPIARQDEEDAIFVNKHDKYQAIIEETKRCFEKGQPVLIGTRSIGVNEALSSLLKKAGIPHQVLNAKNDEKEAEIIAQAGQKKMVTVATNMAGRGTDIKLGDGVKELGGLIVLGSERHEAKRIDDQLRGRSGRQGDPGLSRFYVSLDDDLFQEFATEETKASFEQYQKGKGSVQKMRQLVDRTQQRAQGLHYDGRKKTLEYDTVLMEQRSFIYQQRDKVLDLSDTYEFVEHLMNQNLQLHLEQGNQAFSDYMTKMEIDVPKNIHHTHLKDLANQQVQRYFAGLDEEQTALFHTMNKRIFLTTLDRLWIQHVDVMEHLKHSVGLRGYAQIKPEEAYKEEANNRFNHMMMNIVEQSIDHFMTFRKQFDEQNQSSVTNEKQ